MAWLTTVDHKKLGILYIVTAVGFFILSGLLALVMRLELAAPGNTLGITPDLYNQFFSMHGTGMIFLFIIPILTGFANYLVPLQIGARDMAFPQLNALSYWLYLFVGAVHVQQLPDAPGAAAVAGQLSSPQQRDLQPRRRDEHVDRWPPGAGGGFADGGGQLHHNDPEHARAGHWPVAHPGFLLDGACDGLHGAGGDAHAQRRADAPARGSHPGTQFFAVASGGDPVLWQHLFWFYSHPAVYIMCCRRWAWSRSPAGVLAQALVRLQGDRVVVDRHRGDGLHDLGAPHVHDRLDPGHAGLFRAVHHGDRRADRGEDVQTGSSP
jgi:cytochrome c oxidase subunit 1